MSLATRRLAGNFAFESDRRKNPLAEVLAKHPSQKMLAEGSPTGTITEHVLQSENARLENMIGTASVDADACYVSTCETARCLQIPMHSTCTDHALDLHPPIQIKFPRSVQARASRADGPCNTSKTFKLGHSVLPLVFQNARRARIHTECLLNTCSLDSACRAHVLQKC